MTPASVAAAAGGFACFVNLYALQSMLPSLRGELGLTHAQAGLTITASVLAMALGSPFGGALVARFPRRRLLTAGLAGLVLTTVAGAFATSLAPLVFCRFLQGLCLPPMLAALVNFIGSHWQGRGLSAAMSNYVTWTVIGGFLGRFVAGQATEEWGWRVGLVLTAGMTAAAGAVLLRFLPPDSPLRAERPKGMLPYLRSSDYQPAFLLGFAVLFTLVATFTYIPFHLAAPPFRLGPDAIGRLFCVYLLGVVVTPLAGILIARVGYRSALLAGVAATLAGVVMTLAGQLPTLVAGLALISSAAFVGQAATTGYVSQLAGPGRATALSIYMTFYYAGGSLGALLPGLLWGVGGWTACALLLLLVQFAGAWLLLVKFRPEVGREATSGQRYSPRS